MHDLITKIQFAAKPVDQPINSAASTASSAQTGDMLAIILTLLVVIACIFGSILFVKYKKLQTEKILNSRHAHITDNNCNISKKTWAIIISLLTIISLCTFISTKSIYSYAAEINASNAQTNNMIPDTLTVYVDQETGEMSWDSFNITNTENKLKLKTSKVATSAEVAGIEALQETNLEFTGLETVLFSGAPSEDSYDIDPEIKRMLKNDVEKVTYTFEGIDNSLAKQLIGKTVFEVQFTGVNLSVSKPTAITGLVYNGNEQTGVPDAPNNEYTITDNKGTNASNSYSATATIVDTQNDGITWEGEVNDPQPLSISWSIGKKTVGIGLQSSSNEYNGQAWTPTMTVSGVVDGDTVTVTQTQVTSANQSNDSNDESKDAGSYKIEAKNISNTSNYQLPSQVECTKTFTITKIKVSVATWEDADFTYDGNVQYPKVASLTYNTVSGESVEIENYTKTAIDVHMGETPDFKDAGNYRVTASGLKATSTNPSTNPSNYELTATATKAYTINPCPVGITGFTTTSFTFNNDVQAPTTSLKDGAAKGDDNLSLTDNSYQYYKGASTKINKADSKNADSYKVEVKSLTAGQGTKLRNYVLSASVSEGGSLSSSYSIGKKTVTATWNTPSYTFNALSQKPTTDPSGSKLTLTISGDEFSGYTLDPITKVYIQGTDSETNSVDAGSYREVIKDFKHNNVSVWNNFEISTTGSSQNFCDYTITQKTLTLTWTTPSPEYVFKNDIYPCPDVNINTGITGQSISPKTKLAYNVQTPGDTDEPVAPINVGTYYAQLKEVNAGNTATKTTNYSIPSTTFPFEIKQAQAEVWFNPAEDATIDVGDQDTTTSYVYSSIYQGTASDITLSSSDTTKLTVEKGTGSNIIVKGIVPSSPSQITVTVTLADTTNCKGASATKKYTVEAGASKIDKVGYDGVYTGTAHTAQLKLKDTWFENASFIYWDEAAEDQKGPVTINKNTYTELPDLSVTDVGSMTIHYKTEDPVLIEGTVTLTVSPKLVDIQWTSTPASLVYNPDSDYSPTASVKSGQVVGDEAVEITSYKYYKKLSGGSPEESSNKPKDAGTYFTVAQGLKYSDATKTAQNYSINSGATSQEYTISPATPELSVDFSEVTEGSVDVIYPGKTYKFPATKTGTGELKASFVESYGDYFSEVKGIVENNISYVQVKTKSALSIPETGINLNDAISYWLNASADGNWAATSPLTHSFLIKPAPYDIAGWDNDYDADSHYATVSIKDRVASSQITIKYSTDPSFPSGEATKTTTIPIDGSSANLSEITVKDVADGPKTIYIRIIESDGNSNDYSTQLKVNPKTVDIEWSGQYEYEYNGNPHSYSASVKNGEAVGSELIQVNSYEYYQRPNTGEPTKLDSMPVNVGTYFTKAIGIKYTSGAVTQNYKISDTTDTSGDYVITPADPNLQVDFSPAPDNVIYPGKTYMFPATFDGDGTLTANYKDDYNAYFDSASAEKIVDNWYVKVVMKSDIDNIPETGITLTDAITYSLSASNDGNYKAVEPINITFVLKPQENPYDITGWENEYDGQSHYASVTLKNDESAEEPITIKYNTDPTIPDGSPSKTIATGDKTATLDGSGYGVTHVSDGVLTIYVSITSDSAPVPFIDNVQLTVLPKSLTVTWSDEDLEYNGSNQIHTASYPSGAIEGDTVSVADYKVFSSESSTEALTSYKDAKTYFGKATFSITSTTHDSEATDYDCDGSHEYTIKKRSLTKASITFDNCSEYYSDDGQTHTITLSITDNVTVGGATTNIITNDDYFTTTDSVSSAKEVGSYTITLEGKGNYTNKRSIVWGILTNNEIPTWATYNSSNKTLSLVRQYWDTSFNSIPHTLVPENWSIEDYSPFAILSSANTGSVMVGKEVEKVNIDPNLLADLDKPQPGYHLPFKATTTTSWFYKFENLEDVSNFKNLYFGANTNVVNMFRDTKIKELDLSAKDTKKLKESSPKDSSENLTYANCAGMLATNTLRSITWDWEWSQGEIPLDKCGLPAATWLDKDANAYTDTSQIPHNPFSKDAGITIYYDKADTQINVPDQLTNGSIVDVTSTNEKAAETIYGCSYAHFSLTDATPVHPIKYTQNYDYLEISVGKKPVDGSYAWVTTKWKAKANDSFVFKSWSLPELNSYSYVKAGNQVVNASFDNASKYMKVTITVKKGGVTINTFTTYVLPLSNNIDRMELWLDEDNKDKIDFRDCTESPSVSKRVLNFLSDGYTFSSVSDCVNCEYDPGWFIWNKFGKTSLEQDASFTINVTNDSTQNLNSFNIQNQSSNQNFDDDTVMQSETNDDDINSNENDEDLNINFEDNNNEDNENNEDTETQAQNEENKGVTAFIDISIFKFLVLRQ